MRVGLVLGLGLAACNGNALMNDEQPDLAASDSAGPRDMSTDADLPGTDLSNDFSAQSADLLPLPPDLSAPCSTRAAGEWHVSPVGSDIQTLYSGNGSSSCPLKTVTRAIALASADGMSATIFLHKSMSPTVYGKGCTGGQPCDTDFQVYAQSVSQSLTLVGDGSADIVLTGDWISVVTLNANAGPLVIDKLSIVPTRQASSSSMGGTGITISNSTVTITNTMIQGITPTGAGTGTWLGLNVNANSGTVTIGPGVSISGGAYGVVGNGGGNVNTTLIGSPSAPSSVSGASLGCLTQTNIATTIAGTKNVSVTNCGGTAVSRAANIDGLVLSNNGSSLGGTIGVGGAGTIANTDVSDIGGDGIDVPAGINTTIAGGVTVKNVTGSGVHVHSNAGLAQASITGLTANGNQGDGVRCDGSAAAVALRSSSLIGNAGNGLLAFGSCQVDLGAASVAGANVFDTTTSKNGLAGLCLLESQSDVIVASGSTFSCGYSGIGCTSTGTPTMITAASCQISDITVASGLSFSAPNSECCD